MSNLSSFTGFTGDMPVIVYDRLIDTVLIRTADAIHIDRKKRNGPNWVLNQETGIEKLSDCFDGREIWSPHGWQNIVAIYRKKYETSGATENIEKKRVFQVTIGNGSVIVTEGCKVLTSDNKVREVYDCLSGDMILTSYPTPHNRNPDAREINGGERSRGAENISQLATNRKIPDILLNEPIELVKMYLELYGTGGVYGAESATKAQKLYYLIKSLQPHTPFSSTVGVYDNNYILSQHGLKRTEEVNVPISHPIGNGNSGGNSSNGNEGALKLGNNVGGGRRALSNKRGRVMSKRASSTSEKKYYSTIIKINEIENYDGYIYQIEVGDSSKSINSLVVGVGEIVVRYDSYYRQEFLADQNRKIAESR